MTNKATVAERVGVINRLLGERGHRLTKARTLVLSVLVGSETGGLCAEDIYAAISQTEARVNLSTVYRNLEMLLRERLVSVLDIGGSLHYYLLEPGKPQHFLVCNYCGRVREVNLMYLAPLRDRLLIGYNFEPEFTGFTIHGRCDACRSGGVPRQEDFEIADLSKTSERRDSNEQAVGSFASSGRDYPQQLWWRYEW